MRALSQVDATGDSPDAGKAPLAVDAAPFSLATGGPFHALLRRIGLVGPDLDRIWLRAAVLAGIAYLPLLVLATLDGRAWEGTAVPLLRDADVAARLLVVIPLLVFAERIVHERFPTSFARFAARGLVRTQDQARFDAIVARARRVTGSTWTEALLVMVVVGFGVAGLGRSLSGLGMDTWYVEITGADRVLRPAAMWLLWVSLPMFQFLLLRWWLRLGVWAWMMWRISRLPLSLQPLHPDQSGGIGFLGTLATGFAPLCAAHGAMAAGWIGNQIFYRGAALAQFKLEVAALVVIVLAAILAPLLLFCVQLERAKRAGLGRYGNFATRYASDFEGKWLRADLPPSEPPLGTGDIQSLADLGNSYAAVRQMRIIPFSTTSATHLGLFVLAPVAPLLLTRISVEELLQRLVQMVL